MIWAMDDSHFSPVPSKDTIKSLEKIILCMEKEIKQLEQKLQLLLVEWQPEQLKSVSSIKGIGKRAAAMLIVFTQGFKHTQSHRQNWGSECGSTGAKETEDHSDAESGEHVLQEFHGLSIYPIGYCCIPRGV